MIKQYYSNKERKNNAIKENFDLVVLGGGLSGVCAAIAAARNGIKVSLIQDRPVLGGNASSEIRMWILGATSHMGNNNRWSREGGVIDEILVENMYRNKEGNAVIFDTILLEKVILEPNIELYLNTCVYEVKKESNNVVKSVKAFCSQTSTEYLISASFFIDASGDGIVGFLSGAPFRMGAETKDEFNELFAPDETYGKMLGHTIYFYSKDLGKEVKYIAPSYALKDIKKIPHYRNIKSDMQGCQFWWFEYGGREKDTIKETENIKWELWKVVYGVWDYIKNSGNFPEAANLTLDWVGLIPGKRESRRFEGKYMLKQNDIVNQTSFYDSVAYGGWAIDLHPGDGVYSNLPSCNQYHSKGIYDIPYRSLISKSITNLLFAGRIISSTHVAFGSTRVMATSAHIGQAVGMAAAICKNREINTHDLLEKKYISTLQNILNFYGQSIIGKRIDYTKLGIAIPKYEVSSTYKLNAFTKGEKWSDLKEGFAQLIPIKNSKVYTFTFYCKAIKSENLTVQIRKSSRKGNYTPDVIVQTKTYSLKKGFEEKIIFEFNEKIDTDQYIFLTLLPNESISVKTSSERITGVLSVFKKINKAVSNNGEQVPPNNTGFDTFEFWTPKRRPNGENLAFHVTPAINLYNKKYLNNGYTRPYLRSNAWSASLKDESPEIKIIWSKPQFIDRIKIFFDTDFDHPMENVLMGHPESVMPFCVRNYKILDENDNVLYSKIDNYQTINDVRLKITKPVNQLKIKLEHPSKHIPASVFEVICYSDKLLHEKI